NNADIRYGGGNVTIDSIQQVVTPIHLIDARPSVSYNKIRFSADAAMSANPDSFQETNFSAPDSLGIDYQATKFTPDYDRIGPDLRGNLLVENSINGLFVRISTPAGDVPGRMNVTGRWDDTDIVHVVPENLLINSRPGGPIADPETGELVARTDAGLRIDPNMIVKLDGSRIEVALGAQLLAEGVQGQRVVFTSLNDLRFGAGGTFVTSAPTDNREPEANPGDWGGIFVHPNAKASIDHAVIAYGGGLTRVEGSFAAFNAIEVRQGHLRLSNSDLENNANGRGGQAAPGRVGRGVNGEGVIFVRGARPIILDNIFRDNTGFYSSVVNIDVNSLDQQLFQDYGRSTGSIDIETGFRDNQGPLVRANRLTNNSVNGMQVRGAVLATQSVWDDTDIVHVLFDQVLTTNFHTYGGVRLESSADESLVVKLLGNDAGFKASGRPLEIEDRIGGSVQVVGQPGSPVVLTSLADDSVGAGFDPFGRPQNDTDGFRRAARVQPAGSFQIDVNFGPRISEYEETMEAVLDAVRFWESLLEDPITVTFDVEVADLGNNTLGVGAPEFVDLGYDAVRQALIDDARVGEEIAARLPAFADLNVTLPVDEINPFTLNTQMQVATANAKALGFNVGGGPASLYDPSETRDGTIEFNLLPIDNPGTRLSYVDFDRSDGIQPNYSDFVGTAIHEIGHALGFISAVDDVAAGIRDVRMSTLDMFRLEPGQGDLDFTNSPRALDPSLDQVLYDGGYYDPFGIDVPNLTVGDIPTATGLADQASHWLDNMPFIGIMNPTGDAGREENTYEADRIAFDLIGFDVVGDGIPGDWRGITLEQYSNDRNVAVVTEFESAAAVAPGTNATPGTAQVLGALGRAEKDSDENLRLGFEIHGFLNARADVDVYSFDATAGTLVWFDIDRSAQSVDTLIELVDSNGLVLARSNDSIDDSLFGSTVTAASGVTARGMQNNYFDTKDHFSTNVKDAGMRVILPGAAGRENTYHIRVRSNADNINDITDGNTFGAYQLQLRLQNVDEVPGSTVQFADIRYAADGIRVTGLPAHSPLIGENSEAFAANDQTALPHNSKVLFRVPGAAAADPFT
ncbi:MAG: NF038122 family metalloprotease, partial [Planctomycetales bacterium]|nr:NF038122 family metalloprotease [Planctomycetales bacterium]